MEALGFYLAYFLLGVMIGAVVGALIGAINFDVSEIEINKIVVNYVSVLIVLYCSIISLLIVIKKRLYKNFVYVLLIPICCVMSFFGGAFLGLIIPTYLTTRSNLN